MEPTLKQLRAFVVVADTGQFTRAAERLDLSQSAVSTLIRQLERSLGLRLFDRHTRVLRLTEAGEDILPVARHAVSDVDIIVENSQELGLLRRGRVAVAAGTLQAALTLPRVIGAFNERFPTIEVRMYDVSERAVIDMVKSGTVDIGIGTVPDDDSEIVGTRLSNDVFLLVLRPEHPLARRKNLSWADLEGIPLIGPQTGNPIRERLEAELAREGIVLKFHRAVQDVTLPLTIVGMVEGGLGIAVLTCAVERLVRAMGLVTVTPGQPVLSRAVSVILKRDRSLSPAARQFRDFVLRSAQGD
ncbi:DNA-binding transcriptional LysR family regulator [Amaricoccus macauensis]|uniref:DNA-binding transcriptional LysR family regulator n=1 Tax=Amaricoccus macauensis TaxID=57001 RepID=A0A840SSW8_9RHOB|nr:LysR family transcriptional regulator [Amaricoccus macauensis]MBB5223850.1 DNA-binding transcriptional LysR family regulator [Amaricoccus macauensis]